MCWLFELVTVGYRLDFYFYTWSIHCPFVYVASHNKELFNILNFGFNFLFFLNWSLEWCQHQSHVQCSSFFVSHFNSTLAKFYEQKCLCESCGFQHHMPRDPGGVLPTCVSDNKQTDLSTGCGTNKSLGNSFSLLVALRKYLANPDLSRHWQSREPFSTSRFTEERFPNSIGENKNKIRFWTNLERVKQKLPVPLLLKMAQCEAELASSNFSQ